jgi:hypothetical protein
MYKHPNCCRAYTAKCLACTENISVQEFCSRQENSKIVGCNMYQFNQAVKRSIKNNVKDLTCL